MVQAAAQHDSETLPSGEPLADEARWRQIFASLATLETGLDKVKRDLDRMGGDIGAFRTSLDACDIAPANRAPRTRR